MRRPWRGVAAVGVALGLAMAGGSGSFAETGGAAPPWQVSPANRATEAPEFLIQPLPDQVAGWIRRWSWRPGCPVPLEDLVYVIVTHRGFDGRAYLGDLVVHRTLADEVVAIFRDLFDAGFPLTVVALVDHHQGDDNRSMAANNSSAFNCRPVAGRTTGFSRHSYGVAIDINPLLNPYVRGDTVLPPEGAAYLDRSARVPGMVVEGGPCHRAFVRRGWRWGGDFRTLKDYQHFDRPVP